MTAADVIRYAFLMWGILFGVGMILDFSKHYMGLAFIALNVWCAAALMTEALR